MSLHCPTSLEVSSRFNWHKYSWLNKYNDKDIHWTTLTMKRAQTEQLLQEFPLPDQPEYSYLSFFFRLQGWPKSISYLLFLVYRHVKPNNQMKYFLWYWLIIDIATCMRYKVFAVPIRMEERCKSIFISFSMGIIKELSHQIFKFWFDFYTIDSIGFRKDLPQQNLFDIGTPKTFAY